MSARCRSQSCCASPSSSDAAEFFARRQDVLTDAGFVAADATRPAVVASPALHLMGVIVGGSLDAAGPRALGLFSRARLVSREGGALRLDVEVEIHPLPKDPAPA